jgi:hypothetical protein
MSPVSAARNCSREVDGICAELQAFVPRFLHEPVDVDPNKNANLTRALDKGTDAKVTRCAEIPDQNIEKMDLFVLKDTLDLLDQGAAFFIGEELGGHGACCDSKLPAGPLIAKRFKESLSICRKCIQQIKYREARIGRGKLNFVRWNGWAPYGQARIVLAGLGGVCQRARVISPGWWNWQTRQT